MIAPAQSNDPLLLRLQNCDFDSPSRSLDFQTRVGHPEVDRLEDLLPCVLVLTRADDREIDELSLTLASDGIPLLRVDSDRCQAEHFVWNRKLRSLHVGGNAFRPVVSWLRYFSPTSFFELGDRRARLLESYLRVQWGSWMTAATELPGASAINKGAGPDIPNRITQLEHAHSVGLNVPQTVVTSDPAAAVSTIPGTGDLIVKSLGAHSLELMPGRCKGLFPQRLSRRDLLGMAGAEAAPVMIQEFVEARRELRLFVVGDSVASFEVGKESPSAFWVNPDEVTVASTDIEVSLAVTLVGLSRHWDLNVAAYDVLDTEAGYVFLEVNPMCDWLVFERPAGSSAVSGLVHTLVRETYARGLAEARPRGMKCG